MRVLTLDIETAPNVGHVWGLWQQNVGLPQLLESGYVLCFAAKWEHEDKVRFHRHDVAKHAHALLSQADVIVHYNGTKFDIPWLQSEMVRAGMVPPAPFAQVDLCGVVKQRFRFPSNKLEYVASELLGEGKAPTGGHHTWIGCMAGDPKAWARMREYNEADVLLTERLYQRLKPWIKLPNPALYGDADVAEKTCPGCGSSDVRKRGLAYTTLTSYQRYQCVACGRWGRGKNRVKGVDVR
jgi:hypothetical protein